MNWNSFKNFAQRYMVIIDQLPKGFCSALVLTRYDTDAMAGSTEVNGFLPEDGF